MNISKDQMIGELVAKDYRAASVFKKEGIDFCCNGNRSIQDVCQQSYLDSDELIEKLQNVMRAQGTADIDFQSWDLDLLADYIEKKHHRYVETTIPELKAYLKKIADVHGDRHPELHEIEALFLASAGELVAHMKKEELILFPYVRKMVGNSEVKTPGFGTVTDPIAMMMKEHDNEGVRFRKISELSGNYTPPADGCNTYKVAFSLLQEFEDDLHKHIHLENNILFPKAIEMEKVKMHDSAQ